MIFKFLPEVINSYILPKTQEELDYYYNYPFTHNTPKRWYMVKTSQFISKEGIDFFDSIDCKLSNWGPVLSLPENYFIMTHTDWSASSMFWNLLGDMEVGFTKDTDIMRHDPVEKTDYILNDGRIITREKILHVEFNGEMPIYHRVNTVKGQGYIVNTEILHYGITGNSSYLFFSAHFEDPTISVEHFINKINNLYE